MTDPNTVLADAFEIPALLSPEYDAISGFLSDVCAEIGAGEAESDVLWFTPLATGNATLFRFAVISGHAYAGYSPEHEYTDAYCLARRHPERRIYLSATYTSTNLVHEMERQARALTKLGFRIVPHFCTDMQQCRNNINTMLGVNA